jgi:UDP-N-acetylmuramate dehydrogenase
VTPTAAMNLKRYFPTVRGEVRRHELMAQHISWRVGGPADYYFCPCDRSDLSQFLQVVPSETPLLWVGLGSNLLVRDAGFRGAVICCHGGLSELTQLEDRGVVAEAGVACAKVARFCAKAGFSGAEFLAGIPGTVGGALAMNAGAFGSEIWDIVDQVELINRDGRIQQHPTSAFKTGYRWVELLPDHWFVGATLKLVRGAEDEGRQRIRSLLVERSEKQPIQASSAGSVFRNPTEDHAARLIDQAGLKGLKVGGAMVSHQHANFIVNTGNACAWDIEKLIACIQTRVKAKFGVLLETEVRIVGDRL